MSTLTIFLSALDDGRAKGKRDDDGGAVVAPAGDDLGGARRAPGAGGEPRVLDVRDLSPGLGQAAVLGVPADVAVVRHDGDVWSVMRDAGAVLRRARCAGCRSAREAGTV
jgi:hypothetical protein